MGQWTRGALRRVWNGRIAILGVALAIYSAIGLPGVSRTETVKEPSCKVCASNSPAPSNTPPAAPQETTKHDQPSSGAVIAGLALGVLLLLAGSAKELLAVGSPKRSESPKRSGSPAGGAPS